MVPHVRVSTRFTLSLAAASAVLFGAQAFLLLDKELDDLRAASAAEIRLLGRSLKVAIENALRDQQEADITEILLRLEAIDPNTDVAVYSTAAALRAATPGFDSTATLESDAVAAAIDPLEPCGASGVDPAPCQDLTFAPPTGTPRRVVHALALRDDDGSLLGGLILSRPLTAMSRDLAETRVGVILPHLLFVASALGIGALIGALYIARPISRLRRAIGRVRTGDLRDVPASRGKGELAEIAHEFQVMVRELRETRAALAQQAAAQRELELRLRDADRLITVGQVAAGLAHEIGSPLQVLHGRASALLKRLDDPERVRRHAELIVAEARRIADIVQDLLGLVRRRSRRVPVDLAATVRAVVDLLEHQATRDGVSLAMSAAPALPRVAADPDQLQQVVLNLIRNAMQATGAGGRVTVRVDRGGADLGDAALVLAVTDDGHGIDAATSARVFEPFFTTRADDGGTGLGLAVVRSIVQDHGGRARVASEPGVGTTFFIELPLDGPRLSDPGPQEPTP